MADIVDSKTRSRMMSQIRGKDTQPEMTLRKMLHRSGFRYRTHAPELPGRPDLVFPKWKAVVFVHGCFWHRHQDCRFTTTPSSNRYFWQDKFASTLARDARVLEQLREREWRVAVVWECALQAAPLRTAAAVAKWLPSRRRQLEVAD